MTTFRLDEKAYNKIPSKDWRKSHLILLKYKVKECELIRPLLTDPDEIAVIDATLKAFPDVIKIIEKERYNAFKFASLIEQITYPMDGVIFIHENTPNKLPTVEFSKEDEEFVSRLHDRYMVEMRWNATTQEWEDVLKS